LHSGGDAGFPHDRVTSQEEVIENQTVIMAKQLIGNRATPSFSKRMVIPPKPQSET
jgi:hypothetical protein